MRVQRGLGFRASKCFEPIRISTIIAFYSKRLQSRLRSYSVEKGLWHPDRAPACKIHLASDSLLLELCGGSLKCLPHDLIHSYLNMKPPNASMNTKDANLESPWGTKEQQSTYERVQ